MGYVCLLGMYKISSVRIRLDTATLIFYFTLIFMQYQYFFFSHQLPQTQFLKDTVPSEGLKNVEMEVPWDTGVW